ncbi:hypothetical protein Tcan_06662 [Toxocara canis]|uniref:Uncharacterized protein n=1 Tax=Toxocara canis TaxID=6265 RepID=A0A0B2V1G9_TOXCA|nr:hypothetical protein Tcan_06662 [Toxocara canis]
MEGTAVGVEDGRNRMKETNAFLKARSGLQRPTTASSAKQTANGTAALVSTPPHLYPRTPNYTLTYTQSHKEFPAPALCPRQVAMLDDSPVHPQCFQALVSTPPHLYPHTPNYTLTYTQAPEIETSLRVIYDRVGDIRLEEKIELIGDANAARHETKSLKPKNTDPAVPNHCKWHPENRLHVRAAANFLRFDRFMRMRTCDAPKGSRYEQKKELESTSTHSGSFRMNFSFPEEFTRCMEWCLTRFASKSSV